MCSDVLCAVISHMYEYFIYIYIYFVHFGRVVTINNWVWFWFRAHNMHNPHTHTHTYKGHIELYLAIGIWMSVCVRVSCIFTGIFCEMQISLHFILSFSLSQTAVVAYEWLCETHDTHTTMWLVLIRIAFEIHTAFEIHHTYFKQN